MANALIAAIYACDWVQTLARLATHPAEAALAGHLGMLPLYWACICQAPLAVVQALLHAHPAAASTPTKYGELPLHCAAYYQAPIDVFKLLLHAYPEAAYKADNYDWLPLHYATRSPTPASVGVVAALLAAHPEAALKHDNNGDLPNLAQYPAAAITAALRAQAAARRRPAMLAWVAARM